MRRSVGKSGDWSCAALCVHCSRVSTLLAGADAYVRASGAATQRYRLLPGMSKTNSLYVCAGSLTVLPRRAASGSEANAVGTSPVRGGKQEYGRRCDPLVKSCDAGGCQGAVLIQRAKGKQFLNGTWTKAELEKSLLKNGRLPERKRAFDTIDEFEDGRHLFGTTLVIPHSAECLRSVDQRSTTPTNEYPIPQDDDVTTCTSRDDTSSKKASMRSDVRHRSISTARLVALLRADFDAANGEHLN
jgi:hypothetical protein